MHLMSKHTVASTNSCFVGILEASMTSIMNLFVRLGSVVTGLISERVRAVDRRERERTAMSGDSFIAAWCLGRNDTKPLYTSR